MGLKNVFLEANDFKKAFTSNNGQQRANRRCKFLVRMAGEVEEGARGGGMVADFRAMQFTCGGVVPCTKDPSPGLTRSLGSVAREWDFGERGKKDKKAFPETWERRTLGAKSNALTAHAPTGTVQ